MDIVLLVGRILFAALFLGSAVGHLTQTDGMAGYAQAKGVPFAKLSVQLSGVVLALGGLSVLFGIYGEIGSLLLALFLLPTAFLFHNFWTETDPQAKQMAQVSFNKDIALAGAALALAWVFAQGPGLAITSPLI
ncbi:MAG: DoxX family protein [Nocardiaceae bacterium]|nr:DoxX family protein [Nocardiaceae bacterium]